MPDGSGFWSNAIGKGNWRILFGAGRARPVRGPVRTLKAVRRILPIIRKSRSMPLLCFDAEAGDGDQPQTIDAMHSGTSGLSALINRAFARHLRRNFSRNSKNPIVSRCPTASSVGSQPISLLLNFRRFPSYESCHCVQPGVPLQTSCESSNPALGLLERPATSAPFQNRPDRGPENWPRIGQARLGSRCKYCGFNRI
jgi:hypothetical protein